MKILMVCLGNICRSPMAEGIMSGLVKEEGLDWHIDSAGTGAWHVGERPDSRAIATCDRYGIDIRGQRARQVGSDDLNHFDLILTMDASNLSDVRKLARTEEERQKIRPLTSFGNAGIDYVPDPYFDDSFDEVYLILDRLCRDFIKAHQ